MTKPGPYRDGRIHVLTDRCSTCIFRRGAFYLPPGRLKEIVDTNLESGGAITCHETLTDYGPKLAPPAVCRGFYDAHKDSVPALRLAQLMGLIEEDPTP